MEVGYTLMTEQAGPRDLVRHAVAAEDAGFDFAVISDHAFPWLDEQGHSPYAWSVLGAVAQATSSLGLMTYVTCPIRRYHPAIVAQKAATVALLSEGRFTLGMFLFDRATSPKRMTAKVRKVISQRYRLPVFRDLILAGRFHGFSRDSFKFD